MPTYTALFFTDADWASMSIEAETAEHALCRAHAIEDEELCTLNFQSYNGTNGVEQIEIWDVAERRRVAEWLSDELRLRRAAPDLLKALAFCDMTLADLERSKRKGYIARAIKLTRAALAKAKQPVTA